MGRGLRQRGFRARSRGGGDKMLELWAANIASSNEGNGSSTRIDPYMPNLISWMLPGEEEVRKATASVRSVWAWIGMEHQAAYIDALHEEIRRAYPRADLWVFSSGAKIYSFLFKLILCYVVMLQVQGLEAKRNVLVKKSVH